MSESFGERFSAALEQRGHLCVGIDPHPHTLEQFGGADSLSALRTFVNVMADATLGTVSWIKPQVALFERFGSAGFAVLEDLLERGRASSTLLLADAKRGDIGSTMQGYAAAWLKPGSPLEVDGVTLSPYLGPGSLTPAIDLAGANGKGVFVLARTSNPEAAALQDADRAGGPVAQVLNFVASVNRGHGGHLGHVGVVYGATHSDSIDAQALVELNAPILAPGYGAQGANAQQLRNGFGRCYPAVLVNSSRGISDQGPTPEGIAAAIAQAQGELG